MSGRRQAPSSSSSSSSSRRAVPTAAADSLADAKQAPAKADAVVPDTSITAAVVVNEAPTAADGDDGTSDLSTGASSAMAPWQRVVSALEHRNLAYKQLTFETMLMYHKQWLEQQSQPRINVKPDAATLDTRGDDLPLDQLQAVSQSQVRTLAARATAAIAADRSLLHVDRYVYCFDTKAPPADWADVLPDLVALHDANAGFLLAELGLAPATSGDRGFTFLSGFVDDKYAHYLKCALDATLECSTYMLQPAPWLEGQRSDAAEGADRLVSISNGMRQFRRFPSEEPAVLFRRFLSRVNPSLLKQVAKRCMLLTVVDHRAGRRAWVPKMVAKILRNRHKPGSTTSKTQGLNHYVPAVQCLRRERDESQRLVFVRGLQAFLPAMNIKQLLEMPLEELRVRYWTYHDSLPPLATLSLNSPAPPPPPPPPPLLVLPVVDADKQKDRPPALVLKVDGPRPADSDDTPSSLPADTKLPPP